VALLDQTVAAWRSEIVQPLRAVRRSLKKTPPGTPLGQQNLRDLVKCAELAAGQTEQAMLAEQVQQWPASPAPDLRTTIIAVTAYYSVGRPDVGNAATADADAAIEIILSAVSQPVRA
jgi:hypothetical protein